MGCFSGCLMSASIQKLFCGIYSAFKCSFDEFVREKVVCPSYSSTILGPHPMVSFKTTFSLSSFTFIKRLFSSSLLSAIRGGVIYISAVIDISPSNLDSSLAFRMMYSAYKLNKQGDNIQS